METIISGQLYSSKIELDLFNNLSKTIVYLGMELISDDLTRQSDWYDYGDMQRKKFNYPSFDNWRSEVPGIQTFPELVNAAAEDESFNQWIAYASPNPIQLLNLKKYVTPTFRLFTPLSDEIEMIGIISTNPDCEITTHMSFSRTAESVYALKQ